jgi:hypothetical protein
MKTLLNHRTALYRNPIKILREGWGGWGGLPILPHPPRGKLGFSLPILPIPLLNYTICFYIFLHITLKIIIN